MQAIRITTEKKKSIIQATGTLTNGRIGQLHHLPNRAKRPVGNRAKEKSSGSRRSRNTFLTTQLKPIYTQQLVCEWDDEKTNYITQENYEYLRDSYFRYARLLNKVPHHQHANPDPFWTQGQWLSYILSICLLPLLRVVVPLRIVAKQEFGLMLSVGIPINFLFTNN